MVTDQKLYKDEKALKKALIEFYNISDTSKILEIFTPKNSNDKILKADLSYFINKNSSNPSESAKVIEPFVKHLSRKFKDKKIARVDERFTSKMAFQTMIDSGLKKKARQNKALVDEISATIILQSYMEQQNNQF